MGEASGGKDRPPGLDSSRETTGTKPADGTDRCTLCGLETPPDPVTDESVDGRFCCEGCLTVARELDGFTNPARDLGICREQGHAPGLAESAGDNSAHAETDQIEPADLETTYLQVEGMHCRTCEAFLEEKALQHDGVIEALASYPNGLMQVRFDGAQLRAQDVPALVSGHGYRARLAGETAQQPNESAGRLLVGGFFGMMTMTWYVLFLYPTYLGLPESMTLLSITGPVGNYLLANVWVMATVVLGYTGAPILQGAWVSLRAGRPNMESLIALAATGAYLFSVAALLVGRTEVYFDVTVAVILAVSVGNYYERRISDRATETLAEIAETRVQSATRRTQNGTETVPLTELTPTDRVIVSAGERVPIDGTVREGTAGVDNALVTGESLPERVEQGEDVVGGAIVTDGHLVIEPTPAGERTIDRLLGQLWEGQATQHGVPRIADQLANVFVPLVILLAITVGLTHWLLGASPRGALLTALAVLVVSCPCALGLATPLSIAAGVRDALRNRIVVGNTAVFEQAADASVVVMDKTGTLTTGEMAIDVVAGDRRGVTVAAAVEQSADHPVAEAIVAAADEAIDPSCVDDFHSYPGLGVGATITIDDSSSMASCFDRLPRQHPAGNAGEVAVLVGKPELFDDREWEIPPEFREQITTTRQSGRIPTLVGWAGRARTLLGGRDRPREEWQEAVTELADDRRIVLLSGDDPAAVNRFRSHSAIDAAFAGVPPDAKTAVIERLAEDEVVAMVGDGSNDAPALGTADVGIAMGGGTAMAGDAADVVLLDDDLTALPTVFEVTEATRRRLHTNLGWAFLYNVVALPVAAVGLLNPVIAAGAMATSSLLVVGNSARSIL